MIDDCNRYSSESKFRPNNFELKENNVSTCANNALKYLNHDKIPELKNDHVVEQLNLLFSLPLEIFILIVNKLDNSSLVSLSMTNFYLNEFKVDQKEIRKNICREAARDNNFDLLKWAFSKGARADKYAAIEAAKNGNLKMLEWLHENKVPLTGCEFQATRNGHLHILKWLKEWTLVPLNNNSARVAAENGHLEILIWLDSIGVPLRDICTEAAFNNHLSILKWAREKGVEWDEDVCAFAAKQGHLELLKWARANGAPWNSDVYEYAIQGGHKAVVEWAIANGVPR